MPLASRSVDDSGVDALYQRACAGDPDAFADIYARYSGRVFRIALGVLGTAGEADDVLQSVFTTLWASRPRFHGGSFSAWIATIARNRARDAARKRTTRREVTWPAQLASDASICDAVHLQLESLRVRRALARLPETQRTLIELGFYGEHTHEDLARLTCVPLGTVKTRIRSGLHKLRASLTCCPSMDRGDCP